MATFKDIAKNTGKHLQKHWLKYGLIAALGFGGYKACEDVEPSKPQSQYSTNIRPISTGEKTMPGKELGQAQKIAGEFYVFQNIKDGQTAFVNGKEVKGELPFYAIPRDTMTQTVGENEVTFTGNQTFVFPRVVGRTSGLEKIFTVGHDKSIGTLKVALNNKFKRNENGKVSIPEYKQDTFTDSGTGTEYFLIETNNKLRVGDSTPIYCLMPSDSRTTTQTFNYECGNIGLEGPAYAAIQGTIGNIPKPKPAKPTPKGAKEFN